MTQSLRHKEPSMWRFWIALGILILIVFGVCKIAQVDARTITVGPGELADSIAVATAGDSLVLADGNHDDALASFSAIDGEVGSPIYIIAENTNLATISYLNLVNCDYLYFKGIRVYPWASGSYVQSSDCPYAGLIDVNTSTHIYFDTVLAESSPTPWQTIAAWNDSAYFAAMLAGVSTSVAESISVVNSVFRGSQYGMALSAVDSLFINNTTSEWFTDDCMRVGNYATVRDCTLRDMYLTTTESHGDLLQIMGYGEKVVVHDILIERNLMYTISAGRSDDMKDDAECQGIFMDQGVYNLTIRNNVVIPRATGIGIGLYNVRHATVVNNTVAVKDTTATFTGLISVTERADTSTTGWIKTSDSCYVANNIAINMDIPVLRDSIVVEHNYIHGAPDAYSQRYINQWTVFRNMSNNDVYPADSTVAIVNAIDTDDPRVPALDIAGVTRADYGLLDYGAYEYTGAGGGSESGEPRTWIHPTDLADQTAINDSLSNDDTLLLLRDGVTLKTLSVPKDSIDIGVSGSTGYSTLTGRTQATNWSIPQASGGGAVTDTITASLAGYSLKSNATYLTARNATSAGYTDATGAIIPGQATGFSVYRGYVSFNIPEGVSGITEAYLEFDGNSNNSTTDYFIDIVGGSLGGNIDDGDFDGFTGWASSGAYNLTLLATGLNTSAYSSDWNTFTVNSAGYAAITGAANSALDLFILSSQDSAATEPSTDDYVQFTGGSSPRLRYTYDTSSPDPHLRSKIITPCPAFVTIGGVRQTIVSDTSLVSAAGDTIAARGDTLYVDPADTATFYYSDATGIDLNSHFVTTITGAGSLLLKWHNAAFTEDSTLTVTRVIADSLGRFGNTYKRTITRATIGLVDSIGAGTYTNCLFLTEIDSTKISGNAVFNYCLFDNWTYTPAGDSNSSADFTITGYTPDDDQVYADNGIPFGAITYAEYAAPTPSETPTVNIGWGRTFAPYGGSGSYGKNPYGK